MSEPHKWVYLFKDDFGEYAGYTCDKKLMKEVLKTRKKYDCIKVSYSMAQQQNYIYEEKEFFYSDNGIGDDDFVITTMEEEQYFINSFEQYKSDILYTACADIKERSKILKFNKKEKELFNKFIGVLDGYSEAYQHGLLDEAEYDETGSIYKYTTAYKYFIRKVLGIKIRKEKKKNGKRKNG